MGKKFFEKNISKEAFSGWITIFENIIRKYFLRNQIFKCLGSWVGRYWWRRSSFLRRVCFRPTERKRKLVQINSSGRPCRIAVFGRRRPEVKTLQENCFRPTDRKWNLARKMFPVDWGKWNIKDNYFRPTERKWNLAR